MTASSWLIPAAINAVVSGGFARSIRRPLHQVFSDIVTHGHRWETAVAQLKLATVAQAETASGANGAADITFATAFILIEVVALKASR